MTNCLLYIHKRSDRVIIKDYEKVLAV
jgi:hypothetical protein